jgi:hypothetical protein
MTRTTLNIFVVLCVSLSAGMAQSRSDWQSLAQLKSNDKIQVSQKSGKPVAGLFQSWTPDGVTLDGATIRKDDITRVERFRHSWGRGKKAAVGAAIGFGGGFALGAATGGCDKNSFLCFGRGVAGAVVGVAGMVAGAAIGALLPTHGKELIYARPQP